MNATSKYGGRDQHNYQEDKTENVESMQSVNIIAPLAKEIAGKANAQK
jgi:hypothetical protein